MPTCVRSFCKINLGLAVGPVRADGFHGLTTMYQTIGLHDMVTVSAKRAAVTRITLTSNHRSVPTTEAGNAEKNTAWRMISSALERLVIAAQVEVDIDKRLPVQGGLGAGSANAVAALIGLERELGVSLPAPERLRLAEEIGSDVPLFLLGGAVLGLDRGQQVFPLPDLPRIWCVVAVPNVGVSTAQAFRDMDAKMAGERPQGLKPLEQSAGYGGAEASPLQSEGVAVSPGLKPLQVCNSFSGLKGAAPSDKASFEGYGLQPVRSEQLNQAALAPEGSAGAGRVAEVLTFTQGADRLEELSRAYASVWTTAGLGPGTLRGTTGIASDEVDLAKDPLLTLVRTGIENDFEEVAFSQHPSLRSTKRDLQGDGNPGDPACALYAALSGSGSALFGLYRNQADAIAAQQRVQAAGTQALLTETLPRAEYWRSMFAE